jgi:hypothetical protein
MQGKEAKLQLSKRQQHGVQTQGRLPTEPAKLKNDNMNEETEV